MLAFLLVSGCIAKARRAIGERSVAAGLGPTAMFPLRLRRPVAMFMCASELSLGVALILTAGRAGAGLPAKSVRAATALLFLTAVGALHELRTRRPEVGCGCFGDLSDTPVGLRTLSRSALLAVASVASIGAPPMRIPGTPVQVAVVILATAAEVVAIGALSPELGELLVRLGYSEPCEVRRLGVAKTLAALRSSAAYRRYRRQLIGTEPCDVWREGCWRYVVYPAKVGGRETDIVFAVYLQAHRPPVRVAVIDVETGAQVSGADTGRSTEDTPARARSLRLPTSNVSRRWPVIEPTFPGQPRPEASTFALLAAPVPGDAVPGGVALAPAPTLVPAARRPPVHHAADTAPAGRHAGITRFMQPHTGTHQTRRRHSLPGSSRVLDIR